MPYSKKPRFNLNYILQETGLKADTIRAWERRYQLPLPARSPGGQRLYSEYDLQTIFWLLKRQDEGMRIGQASAYWIELSKNGNDPLSAEHEVDETPVLPLTTTENVDLEDLQSKWLEYCLLFDERNAEQILSQAFAQYPVHIVSTELILPGLRKIGELWAAGKVSVQQEHFTSEIASRKLQALISAAPNPTHKQSILIGNPPGEHHTIVLLVMTLLLKNRGWPVIYLGGNVPHKDLLNTIQKSNVDLAIMTASRLVTSADLKDAIEFLHDNGTPVAYSGWIFSQSENLKERFPGLFLGDDLCEAVNKVEQFINDPAPIPAPVQITSDANLIDKLRVTEPQIIKTIQNKMMSQNQDFGPDDITNASRELLIDITAALRLGDVQYTVINLDWVLKLLTNRNNSTDALQQFISIFAASLKETLGAQAKYIIQFLENYSVGKDPELS